MQFYLPDNLKTQLLPYDPVLKKLTQTQSNKPKSSKPKFPLGQPYDIIPPDVIKTSLVTDAIDNINSLPVEHRVHSFKRIEGVLEEAVSVTCAILYHYESCWYAAWLPPKGQEDQYVYGFAYAYKDTEAARKMVPYRVSSYAEEGKYVTYGRSQFLTYQKLVTKQDLANLVNRSNSRIECGWRLADFSWKKGRLFREITNEFTESVKRTIPIWEDDVGGMFKRLKDTTIGLAISDFQFRKVRETIDIKTWSPSFNSIFELITESAHSGSVGADTWFNKSNKILHIISTPFFRKWIQSKCDEMINAFNDKNNSSVKAVNRPWEKIQHIFEYIYRINNIWPDAPIDYYQNHIDTLLKIHSNSPASPQVNNWLKDNMPVASFFQIYQKFVQDKESTNEIRLSHRYFFNDWVDTLDMLEAVLANNPSLKPPKRWRISEFHDYIQEESWKLKNENVSLPQDLFPNPVRVQLDNKTWSFFQPIDLHQLASWGKAVRNCVGNATHYADNVKKKKHFIVLAMVDNRPTYTIQLEVENGMMSVKQIAGICNSRLSLEEKESYTKAFAVALKQHEEELASKI